MEGDYPYRYPEGPLTVYLEVHLQSLSVYLKVPLTPLYCK